MLHRPLGQYCSCYAAQAGRGTDKLFLNHNSSIFRQSSNPVCGSWKSQASSLWAKQYALYGREWHAQSLTCFIMEKPHTGLDECLNVLQSCFRKRMSVRSGVKRSQIRSQWQGKGGAARGRTKPVILAKSGNARGSKRTEKEGRN